MSKKGNLIFFLNRRCSVGCASCNAGVSEGSGSELTPQWLETFFDKIDDLDFSGYIIWTGGEPFLSFETLKKGISLAACRSFNSEVLTSGIWFKEHPAYLETLATAGPLSLRISLDAEHQERVPVSSVIALIKTALELNIEVNFTLRNIPSKDATGGGKDFPVISAVETQLPDFYRENCTRSRWIHKIPHMPIAPGGTLPRIRGGKWRKACKMGFNDIVIGEDGWVYPCCGLFGIPRHERLAFANALVLSWENPEGEMFSNPLHRMLREKGPYGICRELGLTPEIWNWPFYDTPCHLCLALFQGYGDRVFGKFSMLTSENSMPGLRNKDLK
jgi:MoaA/NifB/PqqE/SkfB family radical SAM enzyme